MTSIATHFHYIPKKTYIQHIRNNIIQTVAMDRKTIESNNRNKRMQALLTVRIHFVRKLKEQTIF